jgi:hypothetical protein
MALNPNSQLVMALGPAADTGYGSRSWIEIMTQCLMWDLITSEGTILPSYIERDDHLLLEWTVIRMTLSGLREIRSGRFDDFQGC